MTGKVAGDSPDGSMQKSLRHFTQMAVDVDHPHLESTSTESPIIKSYENGNEHKLVDFISDKLNHDLALDHWRWKMMSWPSNAANIWIALADDRAVFHYGGIPLRYRVGADTVKAMISVDAKTAPEYRRRGLLTDGVKRAFAEWQDKGFAFTLGLPNERWGTRTEAAGWQKLFPLEWLLRPLRPEVFAARRLGLPWPQRETAISALWRRLPRNRLRRDPEIEFEEIFKTNKCFDKIWETCASDLMFSAVRDAAWVQWRFLSSPTRKYNVTLARRGFDAVGYCASHIVQTEKKTSAFLAELVGPASDIAAQESLLAQTITNCYEAGADVLATLAVPGSAYHKLLRRTGFLRGPAFAVHIVPFAADLNMDQIRKPENWRLNGADFDVL